MKKFKFISGLIIIVILYIFYVNYYLPYNISKSLKKNFFLYFREKVNCFSIEETSFFPLSYKIKNLSGKDFFIKSIEFSPLLKKITIFNGIFEKNFINKVKFLVKNYPFLEFNYRKLEFINSSIIPDFEIYDGVFNFSKNKYLLTFSIIGGYNNSIFKLKGNLENNLNLTAVNNFDNISFAFLWNDILKLPNLNFSFFKNKISGIIKYYGKLDNITSIEVNGILGNFYKLSFKLKNRKIEGIINSKINFNGNINSTRNWNLNFFTKCDNLKFPFKGSDIIFKEPDIAYHISFENGNEMDILKLTTAELKGNSNLYKLFLNLLSKKDFLYSFYIDNLQIDNTTVNNFDVKISSIKGEKSIEKFNFQIDTGKVIFSFLKNDENTQIALNMKNVDIEKLVKFLLNKQIGIDGKFNILLIANSKQNKILNAKGLLFGSDLRIYGIKFEKLNEIFKNSDIFNLNLIGSKNITIDNSTYFGYLKGNISSNDGVFMLKDIFLKSDNFIMKLNGKYDLNDLYNLILTGKYYSQDLNSKDIIINFNFKDKFIQFIGK